MSVSEAGGQEWYELDETERLRRLETENLRAQNAALQEELTRLRAVATEIPTTAGEAAEDDGQPLPSGA